MAHPDPSSYLQNRVREGRVKVLKIDGEFKVVDPKTGNALPDQQQYAWLYHTTNLQGLQVRLIVLAKNFPHGADNYRNWS